MLFLSPVQQALSQSNHSIVQLSDKHYPSSHSVRTGSTSGNNEDAMIKGNPKNVLENWVLEYSVSQSAFHVQQLHESISNNMFASLTGRSSDYLIVGIFPDEEKCHELSIKLLPHLTKTLPEQLSTLTIEDILKGKSF